MMTILVVLRLQRFLMVEVVKTKLHLLLFLGLLFLQTRNLWFRWVCVICQRLHSRQKCNLHCELPSRNYGRTSLTLPLMPMWSKVSGVHLSPASPAIVLDHDHSSPSGGCLSSEHIVSSPEMTHADNSVISQTVPKTPIQQSTHTDLDISLFPLGLTDEKSNGTIALVDDSEDPGANVSNIQLQQKISSLEMKLKVSEEEKQRIKKDVELLLEKHSVLEKDFLKEKEQEAISFQDRYKELQEKHKQELEDMRKAGHEALSIIVDEYKALLQSSVKQQVEAIEKQYISAIEKQAHKCEELLNAQHQRLLEMLEVEKDLLKEKIKEALTQQSQEQKEIFERCLEEERQRNKETLVSAAKLEKEAMKVEVLKAIEEERKKLDKAHAEERELWKTEHAKDQEQVSQAIEKAIQEQRKISQLDQVIRQRSLSSLELFLSCAQKQLSALIATEPVDVE
ncbi:coiled-coil domain-containing protein 91 isoform X2 [Phyllostomus hastatus]|uniref:coiled-coil domain-containing protein 91 isoform X2 n=1 Tax=Phyllostomus hastatus TaxID=9423 RepID=UPI001E67E58C|nr:coiled-coil domain-containing protein 91 isoform X2 [Phyllostomus hastatus]